MIPPKGVKITETESRMADDRSWGEEPMRSYCLIGIELVLHDEKSSGD